MRAHSSIWDIWLKRAVDLAQIAQLFAIVFAAVAIYYSSRQLDESSAATSADIALRFDDRLSKPDMVGIIDAIENNPALPILTVNHGNFSDDQLDQFLGNYDTLYYLPKRSW